MSDETSSKKELLTTGDLARRTGNTLRTVRFYEEEELLLPTTRTPGGHRLFDEDQLHKLQLITDLRNIGLSLPVIREVFRIKHECQSASEASREVKRFLGEQIAAMQERIRLLQRLSDEFQAAMEVFHECQSCKEDWMHRRCSSCEVMARESLPSTVRMIWLAEPENEKPEGAARTPGPIIG